MKHIISRMNVVLTLASTVLWAGSAAARADDQQERTVVVTAQAQGGDDDWAAPAPPPAPIPGQGQNQITIQAIETDGKGRQAKAGAWLGLAVEESSEALSSQLGLKPGEGLTVNFIAADSPAAKADFHKNDVLVELDGQMLVHPMQLRKLVQMHAEGDTIKLTFYRGGKKQTASVKLGKTTWDEALHTTWPGGISGWSSGGGGSQHTTSPGGLQDLEIQLDGLNGQLHGMGESLARAGLDKAKVNVEIRRTMEQTRKAIKDAMRSAKDAKSLATAGRELEALAGEGVDVDKDATVIIRNKGNSIRTMVQADENGTYIIEAGAKTHLIAHDKNGKLLFDGEIDTAAQQEKVPKEVWEKAKPMFDQIAVPKGSEPKGEGKAGP
jgi:hypothetical protein